MSAPEFRSLFNSATFQHWFDKALANPPSNSYKSFIHTGRKDSEAFINNSIVDFVLPIERLKKMLDPGTARKIFKQAKDTVDYLAIEGIEYRKTPSGQEQILIKDIRFGSIDAIVSNVLDSLAIQAGISGVKSQIISSRKAQELARGHVFGFGNTLLFRTKGELATLSKKGGDITEQQLQALDAWIDALIDILEEYDAATSDIADLDTEMFAKYRKTSSKWLIEWQGSEENSTSGSAVGKILGQTGAKSYKGARGVFTGKATEEVVRNFVQQFVDESIAAPNSSKLNLLQQRSSPNMLEMIADTILSSISGKPKKLSHQYTGAISLPAIPQRRVVNKAKPGIAKEKAELKKTKAELKTFARQLRNTKGQFYSLTSLQRLLDANLAQKIKDNMGDGTRRDILNLRSGRFAESVKVERMSQSREGMITAFYTYMKNPYQTFEPGFRQGSPNSRNPRLLISKSIREIAATQVANRMRAVLV